MMMMMMMVVMMMMVMMINLTVDRTIDITIDLTIDLNIDLTACVPLLSRRRPVAPLRYSTVSQSSRHRSSIVHRLLNKSLLPIPWSCSYSTAALPHRRYRRKVPGFASTCHQHRRRFALICATSAFVWPKHLQGTRNRICYRLCRWRAQALRASFFGHSLAPPRRQALPALKRGTRGPARWLRGSSTPSPRRRGSWSSRRAGSLRRRIG